jgi:hypothetical protein
MNTQTLLIKLKIPYFLGLIVQTGEFRTGFVVIEQPLILFNCRDSSENKTKQFFRHGSDEVTNVLITALIKNLSVAFILHILVRLNDLLRIDLIKFREFTETPLENKLQAENHSLLQRAGAEGANAVGQFGK